MTVIDIHAHIFPKVAGITNGSPMTGEPLGRVRVGNELRQFLPPAFENTRSTPEMLIAYMDWCGIAKAVLMPNPYYGYFNDYLIDAVSHYPSRFRAVALTDFLKGKKAAEELASLYDNTCLFGYKIETDSTFQCAPQKHMVDAEFLPIWDCINAYRQPVFVHLFTARDVADICTLAKRFPDIRFFLCHMGADACFGPMASPAAFDALLERFRVLPNLYMDTSTVPHYFQEEYPFPSSAEIIKRGYRAFGPERILWASDYPGMLNHATLMELIDLVKKHCSIPESDLRLIMGENAQRLFFS